MIYAAGHRIFWYFALLIGLALAVVPVFVQFTALALITISAGITLTVTALLGLRRPKRIRLPRRRTLS
jgi:predicted outer membrane lipoprotein